MMNPHAEAINLAMACAMPVMMAMAGTLLLGGLIGWLFSPGPQDGTPAIRKKMADLKKQLAAAEEKLELSGSIMIQHAQQRDVEEADARGALEEEVSALQRQVGSLKMALVAAKREVPTQAAAQVVEKVVADPLHIARIAYLEKENARIPGLLKQIHDAQKPAPRLGKKTPVAKDPATVQPLPTQVYRVMSDTFGRRIAQDDLQLVEGIGPKIKEQLKKNGLKTWADVAAAKPEDLKKVLDKAGDRFHLHDPATWPEQCRMMMEHRWDELRKYQRKLSNAR